MVSTYLSYDLLNRDMTKSLSRIASQSTVERDAEYYKENIGKVKTVDEFLGNYRLFTYATTAYGLQDIAYATAFLKQVLESDLSDSTSFANRLDDAKYREFAAAFNFSGTTEVLQTEAQLDKLIGLYSSTLEDADDALIEEKRYYNIMIDKVTSADQLLRNDRLRNYVFTAFGISGSSYNYSMVKGALTSDLDDPDSYYNTEIAPRQQVVQTRYDEIVATLAEITQREKVTTLISTGIPNALTKIDALQAEIDALEAGPSSTENDELIAAKREQMTTIFTSLDSSITDRAGVEQFLVDNQTLLDDLNARLPAVGTETSTLRSQLISERDSKLAPVLATYDKYAALAAAFNFEADGTVVAGSAQTAEHKVTVNELYVQSNPRATRAKALLERDYYESKIGSITSVDQITGASPLGDERLYNYIKTAFGLTGLTVVKQTITNILTADLDDTDSSITKEVLADPAKLALHNAFNFQTDGTVPDGETAQTAAQIARTGTGYMSRHNDADEAADEKAIATFKREIQNITLMDTRNTSSKGNFFNTTETSVYEFALKAVGIDSDDVSMLTIRKVLASDLSDPKSYVYQTKDPRLLELAKVFNFTSEGKIGTPAFVQSQFEMEAVAKEYIVKKSRFGTADDKTKAEAETKYYTETMAKISSLDEFLADRRLVDVALVANGLDPEEVDDEFLKKIFTSDLDDPESFINTQDNRAFVTLVASFNFDSEGNLMYEDRSVIQTRRALYEMHDLYLRQTMEVQAGEENAGVRLALYFQRMVSSINSYYDVLADEALQEVFRVAFSLPEELTSMDVDVQASLLQKNLDIKKLADPEEVRKLIVRFTMLYDVENNVGVDPVLGLFTNTAGAGISADTLLAIEQIGR